MEHALDFSGGLDESFPTMAVPFSAFPTPARLCSDEQSEEFARRPKPALQESNVETVPFAAANSSLPSRHRLA
jgi:hypothetical protein